MSKIASLLTNSWGQWGAGSAGFAAVVQPIQDGLTELPQHLPQSPKTYIAGLIVSGIIQIAIRLIDKWKTKKEAKKAAENAEATK
jgi:hypothetical protein